jgi:type IV pilus assembly protein PilO
VGDLVVSSKLKKFTPDPKASGIITDSSYGSTLNNKLKRETASVSFEGNFNQTQSILRSMERLQPLLLFKGLEVALTGPNNQAPRRLFEVRGNTIQFLPNCQPEPKLTTTFQLEAPLPLTPEELKAANPPAPPPPPTQ